MLEQEGNRLLVEFTSRYGWKLYKTLEEVLLYPQERITFRQLQGPLHHTSDESLLEEAPEVTSINYSGQIDWRVPFWPVIRMAGGAFVPPSKMGERDLAPHGSTQGDRRTSDP